MVPNHPLCWPRMLPTPQPASGATRGSVLSEIARGTNQTANNKQITKQKFRSTHNYTSLPQNGHKQIKRLRADRKAALRNALDLGPHSLPDLGPLSWGRIQGDAAEYAKLAQGIMQLTISDGV